MYNKQYKECRLCQSSLSQFQIDYLKKKYYNSFHFYFAKPISEILGNLQIDHVILYKDLLYFNDENEYFAKCYNLSEQKQIISKLQFKIPTPNLLIVTAHQIVLKRNTKLLKLQKQPVNKVPATNNYQILFNSTQNIDLSSDLNEYENIQISWETSEHNIYSSSNIQFQKIEPTTTRKTNFLNNSNSSNFLYQSQNDKDISIVIKDINKFTNRQLNKLLPNKQQINSKNQKPLRTDTFKSKNKNVIIPKLSIPQISDKKINIQFLINQYDKIKQQRCCQTERQRKEKKQDQSNKKLDVNYRQNNQQQLIYSVPSSSKFQVKGISTCSASILLKSLSKLSKDQSPLTSRRLEIKQNLTNLIRQQEIDLGYYTQR